MDVERIEALQALGKDDLTVLPGIEFRSGLGGNETVHFIGIFPEDANLDDLWTKLSGKLELTPEDVKKKGGDEKVYVPFTDAAQTIHDLGGIVTTHAGGKSNSIKTSATLRSRWPTRADIAREHIDIFELGKASDRSVYVGLVFPAIKHVLPLLMGSDNHNIAEYQPKEFCWIKGDPSFRTFQQLKRSRGGCICG